MINALAQRYATEIMGLEILEKVDTEELSEEAKKILARYGLLDDEKAATEQAEGTVADKW